MPMMASNKLVNRCILRCLKLSENISSYSVKMAWCRFMTSSFSFYTIFKLSAWSKFCIHQVSHVWGWIISLIGHQCLSIGVKWSVNSVNINTPLYQQRYTWWENHQPYATVHTFNTRPRVIPRDQWGYIVIKGLRDW